MIARFVCIFLLTLLVAVPGSSQEPTPDPHQGQPAYCVNHPLDEQHPMNQAHACMCAKPCEEGGSEDPMCRVYCRKDHCHCLAMCGS